MAYKTPEQMIDIIMKENLLTDACMTILEGRNDYNFKALKIPQSSVTKKEDGSFVFPIVNEKNERIEVPVVIPETNRKTSFWLISFKPGRYDVIAVQHDETDENQISMEKKEYLSVIAMFLDHYHVGTKIRLMNILKNGYVKLKKEIGEDDAYELLRDRLSVETDIRHAEQMPDKFGVRFNFHAFDKAQEEDKLE